MGLSSNEQALRAITKEVIGGGFAVSNTLGCGFLEKVYENALAREPGNRGLSVEPQTQFEVRYAGGLVGTYYADLVVDKQVIVEVKAVRAFDSSHEAQCINYLKASGLRVCLLLNFARPRLQYRRFALTARPYQPQMNADARR